VSNNVFELNKSCLEESVDCVCQGSSNKAGGEEASQGGDELKVGAGFALRGFLVYQG
jgi:hypothetical protein